MIHRPPKDSVARAARRGLVVTIAAVSLAAWAGSARAHLALVRLGQESAGIAGSGDELGRAVAAGDFNGDGVEDLASGAALVANNLAQTASHGAVIVNFGSARGLVPEGAQWLTVGDVADLQVHYGDALAVGDFDGDGYDDLAVGAPYMDAGGSSNAGVVWIHHGSPTGLQDNPAIVLDQSLAGGAREAEDRFGHSLATADFDLDGHDDLAVGSPGEDAGAGAVFHFYGSAAGITSAGAGWFKQSSLVQVNTPGDAMGQSLAAGRLDNDAYPDLAIGTPFKDLGSFADCGRVYVVRGTSLGLTASGSVSYDPVSLPFHAQNGARFGSAVAVGHFHDANGPADLAIGAPGATVGASATSGGRVAVLDLDPVPAPSLVPQSIQGLYQLGSGSAGAEPGDQFGLVLAAGRFDLDDYDDLAVAAPYENQEMGNEGTFNDAGEVRVFTGGANAMTVADDGPFDPTSQNDVCETGMIMGWSLAFGRFDDSGRDNLAVGAIRKDYVSYRTGTPTVSNAGLVYVIAPWRQIRNLPHRASVLIDCDGDIVYSQRLFDSLRPASTTKTMTLLLACEAVENGSADPDHLYTVPSWVANNVGGSQMGLVAGEKITLENLMKGLMPPSGNDAAVAISDILEGDDNPWGGTLEATLPAFQARMNARAADFGMTRTHFTNAPGLDLGNHYTCARDFTALAYYAMQNTCVRQIVGAPGWLVDHLIPVDTQNGWLSLGGPSPTPGYTPVTEYFSAGYMTSIRSVVPSATGVKGGHTPGARVTGLWSAPSVEGEVYAGAFGLRTTDDGDSLSDCLSCTGGALLELGRSQCTNDDFAPPPPPPPDGPFGTFTSVPACPDSVRRLTVSGEGFAPTDARVQIYRRANVSPSLGVRLAIVRSSQVTLPPQGEVLLGAGAVSAHQGVRVTNRGGGIAIVQVNATFSGTTLNASLLPESALVLPRSASPASVSDVRVRNTGTTPAVLDVEELGYQIQRTLGLNVPGRPAFETTLKRGGDFIGEVFGLYVVGTDANCDDDLDLVLTPPGGVTGVADDSPALAPGSALALAPAAPNPSRGGTRLAYQLEHTGTVRAAVYDAQGRRVRTLLDGEMRAPGSHVLAWDGADDAGARARAGIYFVRIEANGAVRSRSVIRLP